MVGVIQIPCYFKGLVYLMVIWAIYLAVAKKDCDLDLRGFLGETEQENKILINYVLCELWWHL